MSTTRSAPRWSSPSRPATRWSCSSSARSAGRCRTTLSVRWSPISSCHGIATKSWWPGCPTGWTSGEGTESDGAMSTQIDGPVTGAVTAPEWTHTTRLDAKPPSVMACAYVAHHLVEHRLFELVDVVRVVAGELVASSALRGRTPLTLTLSLATPLVILRVDTESASGALLPK